MGRKKHRKRERAAEQRTQRQGGSIAFREPERDPADDYSALALEYESFRERFDIPVVPMCGGCREFIEDEHGGRGSCLHPGSGIVSPWTDTKACEFFARRR